MHYTFQQSTGWLKSLMTHLIGKGHVLHRMEFQSPTRLNAEVLAATSMWRSKATRQKSIMTAQDAGLKILLASGTQTPKPRKSAATPGKRFAKKVICNQCTKTDET